MNQTAINRVCQNYPICDRFHGMDGFEDREFDLEGDIEEDGYDREL